jgi:hypothetical protein
LITSAVAMFFSFSWRSLTSSDATDFSDRLAFKSWR